MAEPDDFSDDDDDWNESDEADLSCGLTKTVAGEMCLSAGTEWCDFECPYRDEAPQFRDRKRKPPPAPLLDIMQRK